MNLLDLMVKIGVDDQATDKIGGISDGIKSGLGGAARAGAAAMAAAGTAAVGAAAAIGKEALDSYASFEQLAGGVEKLYKNQFASVEEFAEAFDLMGEMDTAEEWFADMEKASELVMENAQNAYKTAGMSTNQYLETATQFSASLTSALAGDVDMAAKLTDVAMRSMSDNVNVFGSNMEDVTNAYKGFSKQNYTMLDNLKLGYGGTKEEMARLIEDAAAMTDVQEELNEKVDAGSMSFDNIIRAIDVVQYKQNIYGTTAKEAATTIEGSLAMTKAAWENLLTEFGKDDGDVGARVKEVVESAKTYLLGSVDEATGEVKGGIIPRLQKIFQSIADALPEAMPVIVEAIHGVVPAVMEAVTTVLPSLLQAIVEVMAAIATELPSLVMSLVPTIIGLAPTIVEAGLQMFLGLVEALTETGPGLIDQVIDVIFQVANVLVEYAPQILEASLMLFAAILEALLKKLPDIIQGLVELLGNLVSTVIEHGPELFAAAVQLLGSLVSGIISCVGSVFDAAGRLGQSILDAIGGFFQSVYDAGANLIGGFIQGIVDNIAGVGKALMDGIGGAVDGVTSFLGIASPSKLFENIGENTMLGLEGGIEGEMSGVQRIMDMVNDSLHAEGSYDLSGSATGARRAASGSGVVINVNVEAREDDPYELARTIGEAIAVELRMQGVCA